MIFTFPLIATASENDTEYVTITFNPNGGSFNDSSLSQVQVEKGSANRLQKYTAPTRDMYRFFQWNTKPDGSGFNIRKYESFTQDITFYAIWKRLFNITLDANGGEFVSRQVNPDTNDYYRATQTQWLAVEQTPYSGEAFLWDDDEDNTNRFKRFPAKTGYKIKRWNTRPDGNGVNYELYDGGDSVGPFSHDETIFAIWECENHTWDNGKVTKEADCGSIGIRTFTCTKCGETREETIPITASHSFGPWQEYKQATESEPGMSRRVCTVCGLVETGVNANTAVITGKRIQTISVKVTTKKVSAKKLKKKAQKITAISLKGAEGGVTYKRVKGSGKLKINKKTGKITVKKNTKKGTYSMTVKIIVSGNDQYEPATKTVKIKVRVK